jgi:hypothetical protein
MGSPKVSKRLLLEIAPKPLSGSRTSYRPCIRILPCLASGGATVCINTPPPGQPFCSKAKVLAMEISELHENPYVRRRRSFALAPADSDRPSIEGLFAKVLSEVIDALGIACFASFYKIQRGLFISAPLLPLLCADFGAEWRWQSRGRPSAHFTNKNNKRPRSASLTMSSSTSQLLL